MLSAVIAGGARRLVGANASGVGTGIIIVPKRAIATKATIPLMINNFLFVKL
jgi:hypothetical protein